MKNETLQITGDGGETRDFTFSDDTCDGIIKAAYSKYSDGEVFNLGAGTKVNIKDLANEILDITQSNSEIIYTKMRSWDHVKHRQSNIKKSNELLGYDPKTELTIGLNITYNWLLKVI
jgi:UDP-glucose 4-epimerase